MNSIPCALGSEKPNLKPYYHYGSNDWAQSRLIEQLDADVPMIYRRRPIQMLNITPNNRKAIETIGHWLVNAEENLRAGRGFWLTGSLGTGKSAILCATAYSLLNEKALWEPNKRALTARYVNWSQVVNATLLTSNRKAIQRLENSLKRCGILFLDDLGTEADTKMSRALAFSLIDYRTSERKPICATSHIALDALEKHLGRRVVDRLAEACPTRYRLNLAGSSYRRMPEQLAMFDDKPQERKPPSYDW